VGKRDGATMINVSIYIESVILGTGEANRGGSVGILLSGERRRAVAQYDGQGVKAIDTVKNIAVQSMGVLKTVCFVTFYSSAPRPSGIDSSFPWQRIEEGSDGWQMRASYAAWEIALGGEVSQGILELACSGPAYVIPKEPIPDAETVFTGLRLSIRRGSRQVRSGAGKGAGTIPASARPKRRRSGASARGGKNVSVR
jgi:hypothetical protein